MDKIKKMTKLIRLSILPGLLIILIGSCKKSNDQPSRNPGFTLSYGDSVFYLRQQATDYLVSPVNGGAGEYSGFPVQVLRGETGVLIQVRF